MSGASPLWCLFWWCLRAQGSTCNFGLWSFSSMMIKIVVGNLVCKLGPARASNSCRTCLWVWAGTGRCSANFPVAGLRNQSRRFTLTDVVLELGPTGSFWCEIVSVAILKSFLGRHHSTSSLYGSSFPAVLMHCPHSKETVQNIVRK